MYKSLQTIGAEGEGFPRLDLRRDREREREREGGGSTIERDNRYSNYVVITWSLVPPSTELDDTIVTLKILL